MLKNYVKVALRAMRRHTAYTAINLTGLAVGLACSFFILLWVQDELGHDRFLPEGDRVYQVWRNVTMGGTIHTWNATPKPLADVLGSDYPDIEAAVQTSWQNRFLLTYEGEGFKEGGIYASTDFFEAFPYPFIQGDPQTALASENGVVITDRTARKIFGDDWQAQGSVLGQPLTLDQRKDFAITGVLEDLPANTSHDFDVVVPLEDFVARNGWVNFWGNNAFTTYVKLREGTSPDDVTGKIEGLVMANEEGADEVLFLQSYGDLYLHSDYENGQLVGGRIQYIRIFSMVAIFLLLIAAINFMNLATARSAQRAREIGVRKAVGAVRPALIGQFLGESMLLAFCAFLLALGLVVALLPLFNDLTGKALALTDLGGRFLLGGLGITLLVGLLAGSYPSLYLSSFNALAVLRGTLRQRPSAALLRKGLVIFQFSLSTVLIVATVAMYLQLQYIHTADIGLDRVNVIHMAQEGALQSQYEAVRQELLKHPGIAQVTAANASPLAVSRSTSGASWEGKAPDVERETYVINADYDFVETMRREVVAGRSYSRAFGADTASFVINEEMARAMGGGDVLGKAVTIWGETGAVIGVVKDFDINSIYAPTEPVIIRLYPEGTNRLFVRTQAGQTAEALAGLEAVVTALNPSYPFEYEFLDAEFDAIYRSEAVLGSLANIFAGIAILIACLGLFGLVSFTAEQRTKEIGVRKVLGASVPRLVLLLTGEVTRLVVLGIVLAIPFAYYGIQTWLANFDAHIEVGSGLFIIAGLMAVAVAWLTVSAQAIKAALADPVQSLRYE